VLLDTRDHALLVLDLVYGVLELPVEHHAVGDHDHGVEDFPVPLVVQAGEAVGEPGDAVGLAAAGGVLDQVAPARTLGAGGVGEPAHGVELVEAWEEQDLLGLLLPVHPPLLALEVHVAAEDVEEAVPLPDLFPQIAAPVAARVLRVASPAVTAPVEREEEGALPRQSRGHEDQLRVHREVHQRALGEAEDRVPGVAPLELGDGVPDVLAGQLVLELHRGDRQTVQEEHQVDGVLVPGDELHLPGHHEPVPCIALRRLRVQPVRGAEVRQLDLAAVELDPLPEHAQGAVRVEVLGQHGEEGALELGAVLGLQFGPELGAGCPR
jgi:hypothetical protein